MPAADVVTELNAEKCFILILVCQHYRPKLDCHIVSLCVLLIVADVKKTNKSKTKIDLKEDNTGKKMLGVIYNCCGEMFTVSVHGSYFRQHGFIVYLLYIFVANTGTPQIPHWRDHRQKKMHVNIDVHGCIHCFFIFFIGINVPQKNGRSLKDKMS